MANPQLNNQSARQREAAERVQGKDSSGNVYVLDFVGASTATAATAGSASNLPASPAGYIQAIHPSNGSVIKIPFYLA